VVTTNVLEELRTEPSDHQVMSRCEAQALVSSVYHQLREAELQSKMTSGLPPRLPATVSGGTVITDAVPDCRGVVDEAVLVDEALLELAAEARQIPAAGSEREALVKQVIRSVVEAHLRTSTYTRQDVEAGFHRYNQVSQ